MESRWHPPSRATAAGRQRPNEVLGFGREDIPASRATLLPHLPSVHPGREEPSRRKQPASNPGPERAMQEQDHKRSALGPEARNASPTPFRGRRRERPEVPSPTATTKFYTAPTLDRRGTTADRGRFGPARALKPIGISPGPLASDRRLAWFLQFFAQVQKTFQVTAMGRARRTAHEQGDLLECQTAPQVGDDNLS